MLVIWRDARHFYRTQDFSGGNCARRMQLAPRLGPGLSRAGVLQPHQFHDLIRGYFSRRPDLRSGLLPRPLLVHRLLAH